MRPNFLWLAPIVVLLTAITPARVVVAAAAVPAAIVELREVEQIYPAEAIVEAVRQATIAAQAQGRIVAVHVDAGSRVKAGELLMRIDPRETAQAQLAAQAQQANALADFERSKQLFRRNFISQAALDKAEASFKVASAAAGQAGVQTSFTNITAPYAGIVVQRLAEPGEMAVPGKPLLSLYDPKGLRAVASIPQYKLGGVKQVLQAWVEFPESGRRVAALRVELLPSADSQTHVVRARVVLPENLEGVMPGMFVRASFVVGKIRKLLMPVAAVLRRGELTAVYVLDERGLPHLRQVRLGEAAGGADIEVLAGVDAGEKVALDPVRAGMLLKQDGK